LWSSTGNAKCPYLVEYPLLDGHEGLFEEVIGDSRVEEGREALFAEVRLDGPFEIDHTA
jgi:hypothetical protein